MINVTLLGTSALIPLPDRAETAALLVCGGHSILFDCGEGTQTAARKAGVSLVKTDVIALTHYHGDHIFGLPGLLQTMSMMGRTEPLTLVGPGDMEKELEHMIPLIGWLPYELKLVSLPAGGVELTQLCQGWPGGARLTPVATAHRVVSQGYVFELPRAGRFMPEKAKALGVPTNQWRMLQKGESVQLGEQTILPEMVMGAPRKGLKVVFSGDTAVCDALEQASQDADLLLCEATYGENAQAQLAADHGHMNFAQAGQLAQKARVRRLWLMHYSQMVEDPMAYLPNAQAFFPGAECGFDGKAITLKFDK
ncbi:MAG: ribonuclease Z [Aristaeellaceae bacterium]